MTNGMGVVPGGSEADSTGPLERSERFSDKDGRPLPLSGPEGTFAAMPPSSAPLSSAVGTSATARSELAQCVSLSTLMPSTRARADTEASSSQVASPKVAEPATGRWAAFCLRCSFANSVRTGATREQITARAGPPLTFHEVREVPISGDRGEITGPIEGEIRKLEERFNKCVDKTSAQYDRARRQLLALNQLLDQVKRATLSVEQMNVNIRGAGPLIETAKLLVGAAENPPKGLWAALRAFISGPPKTPEQRARASLEAERKEAESALKKLADRRNKLSREKQGEVREAMGIFAGEIRIFASMLGNKANKSTDPAIVRAKKEMMQAKESAEKAIAEAEPKTTPA